MKEILVAVGVIFSPERGFFICRRASHQHQGGKWEFPGGKVEAGENVYDALKRELEEEIGIDVQSAHPMMIIEHQYPDKAVQLDVWLVDGFVGEPNSLEGLESCWVQKENIPKYTFPDANQPIVEALLVMN